MPLHLCFSHDPAWQVAVVPVAVNVIQHPLPTGLRCYRLGQAIRRAVESYPDDLKVVILGTGGMSHQLHGARFGHLNPDWDQAWLDKIETAPLTLAAITHQEIMEHAGAEAVEGYRKVILGMINEDDRRKLLGRTVPLPDRMGR